MKFKYFKKNTQRKKRGGTQSRPKADLLIDRGYVLEAVKADAMALVKHPNLKNDREIVLEAVKQKGTVLEHASEELKNDREIVLEAVKKSGEALQYASEALKNDREIVLEAVKQYAGAYNHASGELKTKKYFILGALKVNADVFNHIGKYHSSYKAVLDCVKQNGKVLQYASPVLRGNREIVLEAVKQSWEALQYASPDLRGNREIVLEAVKQSREALQYASEELQNDPEIVEKMRKPSCGEFEMEEHEWNGDISFFHKSDQKRTSCIVVSNISQNRDLYLESFFFGLNEDQKRRCRASCEPGEKIGEKAMNFILQKFKNNPSYDTISLQDAATIKGPWGIGKAVIHIPFIRLSVVSLLKKGLCYYEQMGFYALENPDAYNVRVSQLCDTPAYDINTTSNKRMIDIAKKTSLCGIYLSIEQGKVEDDLNTFLGRYLHETCLKLITDLKLKEFTYDFTDEHEEHVMKLEKIRQEYQQKREQILVLIHGNDRDS